MLTGYLSAQTELSLSECVSKIEQTFNKAVYLAPTVDQDLRCNCAIETAADINISLDRILSPVRLGYIEYSDYALIILEAYRITAGGTTIKNAVTKAAEIEEEWVPIGEPDGNEELATITGYVNDGIEETGIIGATIVIEGTNVGEISNDIGQYELSLPKGRYSYTISALGYEPSTGNIEVLGSGELDVFMMKEAISLDEVVISAETDETGVNQKLSGVEKLSIQDLQKLPALAGEIDVIQSILLLPGVSSVGEGALGINVRGGTVDQNLVLQEGLTLFNSSHLLGLYSAFHPDILKSVELYKGSIPAQYGGALSSVLKVEITDGDYQKFSGKGGLGIISNRLMLTAPIIKGKSSLLLAGRTSYSDWIFNSLNLVELQNSSAQFYDVTAKYNHRLGKGKFELIGYKSYDQFRFDERFDYRWNNQGLNANINYALSDQISLDIDASYSDYQSTWYEDGPRLFELVSGISKIHAKPMLNIETGNHFINIGSEFNFYDINPGDLMPMNNESPTEAILLENEKGRSLAFFIEDEYDLNDKLSISAGVRYNINQYLGPLTFNTYQANAPIVESNIISTVTATDGSVISSKNILEPRASIRYKMSERQSIKLSYAKTHQFVSLLSNSVSVAPIDVWQISNDYIPLQESHGYSIGYAALSENEMWDLSIEAFYKDMTSLITYRDQAELLINDRLETEIAPGLGRSYGVELSIEKKFGRLEGRLGYTYARTFNRTDSPFSEEQIDNNEWFNANFDKPHDLSITGLYKITQRHQFSASFSYSTGRPITAPIGSIDVGNVFNIPTYTGRNDIRIPDYHRLDISYTIKNSYKKDQKVRSSWTFSIYNLYGRRNPFSIFFTQSPTQRPQANRLSILANPVPSITYNFSF